MIILYKSKHFHTLNGMSLQSNVFLLVLTYRVTITSIWDIMLLVLLHNDNIVCSNKDSDFTIAENKGYAISNHAI